ncbi:hypothetical protein [Cohnella sp. GCM10027633]|uniref:hypothetical protein n=1 Tax=unclassified Cohnella TaxID=2636738 RepID=UPI0036420DA2
MGRENKRITIEKVELDGERIIRYIVRYGSKASEYFTDIPFYAEYDRSIRGVPESILVIPLLANLCPVAWIAGVDVYADQVDKSYYESLLQAQASFRAMYPRLNFTGNVYANRLNEDMPEEAPSRSAMFFSGGVDSMGTFIRRREEEPYFITFWGADIRCDQAEMWEEVKRYNDRFGRTHGLESLFVKSNLREFINDKHIAFMTDRFTHGWWAGVQHGIGLVGLVAPLAYRLGIAKLYVPSALPPKLSRAVPDGSNTMINNHLRWTGTQVQLDGEELTRQGKVGLIAEFIRSSEQPAVVRVCWSNAEYGNCCRCEKCLRTIVGLIAEGIDPAQVGFIGYREAYRLVRQYLLSWLPHDVLKGEYWDEIRVRSIRNKDLLPIEAGDFFAWFQALDIGSYAKKRSAKQIIIGLIPHPLFLRIKKWIA